MPHSRADGGGFHVIDESFRAIVNYIYVLPDRLHEYKMRITSAWLPKADAKNHGSIGQ